MFNFRIGKYVKAWQKEKIFTIIAGRYEIKKDIKKNHEKSHLI